MRSEFAKELQENILPFWSRMIREDGSFPGRVSIDGSIDLTAPISSVMAFRILWMLSAAARCIDDSAATALADRVYKFVTDVFFDRENGGVWWSILPSGEALSNKKQSYAIGFAIYALSEYAMLRNSQEAKELAMQLFRCLEDKVWNADGQGYVEAFNADWTELGDVRLSEKDMNAVFTMNTHLHILEPYTNLYMLTSDADVKLAIVRLLDIFRDRIYDSATSHLGSFFNSSWTRLDSEISFGHDIEASWLICEAAEAVASDDPSYRELADSLVRSCESGFLGDGSLAYKSGADGLDSERHWWVQAEAIVGLLKMYKRTGESRWLERCQQTWQYVKDNLIDANGGDWYWSRLPDGSINYKEDKAGFWKCPYHNGRMCIELIKELTNE